MSNTSSGGTPSTPTPFEWLSGGLFFGLNSSSNSTDKAIDSCKNVASLLDGMVDNLQTAVPVDDARGDRDLAMEPTTDIASPSTSPADEAARLLALRLSRLRFLLYDERRNSSSAHTGEAAASPSLFGTPSKPTATVAGDTATGLVQRCPTLLPSLLQHLCDLPFESRKHVAAIFNYLLVCGLDGNDAYLYQPAMIQFRDYVAIEFERIMTSLVLRGHDCSNHPDVSLHCGSMFRSCLRHVVLYEQLVTSTHRVHTYVFPFLDTFVQSPNFDVASDAMESLRLILVVETHESRNDEQQQQQQQQQQQELASQFLERDYVPLLEERFNPKLLAASKNNYMTRRMALQILSTLLLTRANYNVMIRYVANKGNLILCMLLLRDTSPHISLDAFHVFKIFVANPNKPPEIVKILSDNKVKLCRYLETLHQEREGSDAQFRDEKALVISTIEAL